MIRSLLLSFMVLGTFACVAQAAPPAPTVSVDRRYAVASKGISRTDFASNFAADTPNGVAVDGNRIYAVGEADGNVAILAQNATGTYDAGFSDDGKLVLPIAADPSRDFGTSIIVLSDHSLLVVAGTDSDPATGTTNIDVALLKISSTGVLDTGYTQIFGVGTGDDTPTRAAYDAATGRIAIVGNTNATNDSWVAVRNVADGSPAAFGVGGAVLFDESPGFSDQAVDVAWRPGGGLAVLVKLTRDAATSPVNWRTVLHGFTADGQTDLAFAGGSTELSVGQLPTTPSGLLAWGGNLWVTGSTKNNGDTDAFLARVAPDGSGLDSRMFDMHGESTEATDATSSQGIDLDVLEGTVPTLVVVGSSTNLSGAAEWAAAAFNGLDGPLAAMGFGDLTIPYEAGQGAAIGVAAGPGYLGVAGSLLVTSPSAELSFGTSRLLIDAEKECDLTLAITRPLELVINGGTAAPVRFTVANTGTKLCGGRLSAPARYAIGGGALDTGVLAPKQSIDLDRAVTYVGPRKADDIAPFALDTPGDTDTPNNTKLIHVVFNYCDVRVSPVSAPSVMPAEGGRRVEFSVRNTGTSQCRSSRIAAVKGGSRLDAGDRYTIAPARSVTDSAVFELKAGARVGKKASLVVGARSSDEAARDTDDSVTLRPMVVGVGDSAIRSRSARAISGTATGAPGPGKAASRRLTRVYVAIKRLGGTKQKPACSWVRSASASLKKGSCTSTIWVRASGTSSWRLSLSRALPAGRYEIRSRAVIKSGFTEGRFGAKDRNLTTLRVR